MPLPIIAWVCYTCIAAGATYCAHRFSKAYEKGQKTKREKYALKGKSLEAAKEDNKKAQTESDEWKRKYDELDNKIKKRDEEIKKFQNKLRDPNLSNEDRKKINNQLAILLAQQDDDKKEKDTILNKLKQLGDRIKNNNKTISGAGSNPDDKHWIWDLVTLENFLILGGCYVLYKLAKDDK